MAADPDLSISGGWGGGGHPDPEISGGGGGGLQKTFFGRVGPHFGPKITRGPGALPLDPPLVLKQNVVF